MIRSKEIELKSIPRGRQTDRRTVCDCDACRLLKPAQLLSSRRLARPAGLRGAGRANLRELPQPPPPIPCVTACARARAQAITVSSSTAASALNEVFGLLDSKARS